MPLAGVTPPATLSVISGSRNESQHISLASIDWSSVNFLDEAALNSDFQGALPSSEVLRIATLAAESMAPVSAMSPAVNSSFHVQFVGPTMQCSVASGSQQIVFDNYTTALANDLIATKYLSESGKLRWVGVAPLPPVPLMNVYSAFSPMAGQQGWMPETDLNDEGVDVYNNWVPGYGFFNSFYKYFPVKYKGNDTVVMQHLLIQTADQALSCTLGNASFDVRYEFVETAPPLIQTSISKFVPLWTPVQPFGGSSAGSSKNPLYSYMAVYLAFSSLLNGNVSTTLTNSYKNAEQDSHHNDTSVYISKYTFDGNVTIYDSSSKILQHGLSACDDFKQSHVSHLP